MADDRLGLIVEGSLVDGLTARLDGKQSIEDVRVGQFVRITGQKHDYFCLVTDVRLDATNRDLLADPPLPTDAFALQVLAGTTAYGALEIQPMLMLARDVSSNGTSPAATAHPPPARMAPARSAPSRRTSPRCSRQPRATSTASSARRLTTASRSGSRSTWTCRSAST